jgi:hypothetical protein
MNWDAVGAMAELLGAIGVILSLVYLAMQIRQNTKSLEDTRRLALAQSYEHRAQMAHDSILQLRDSEHALEAITRFHQEGADSLTEIEHARVVLDQAAQWERIDNVFKQRQLGFLDDGFFEDFEDLVKQTVEISRLLGADDLPALKPELRSEVERILTKNG